MTEKRCWHVWVDIYRDLHDREDSDYGEWHGAAVDEEAAKKAALKYIKSRGDTPTAGAVLEFEVTQLPRFVWSPRWKVDRSAMITPCPAVTRWILDRLTNRFVAEVPAPGRRWRKLTGGERAKTYYSIADLCLHIQLLPDVRTTSKYFNRDKPPAWALGLLAPRRTDKGASEGG